ncbi:MAG: hypothetical protein QNJ73_03235 [Gammaproteobacteria bacterium]|nr:hypothetical protein [Gammaproteobacteria bacterium]
MFGALLTFIFLYGVIWLFERKHRDIDAFLVAVAVVVPVIASFLTSIGAGVLGLGAAGAWLGFLVLIGATYLSLAKIMGLPGKRAAGYTAAVVVFNLVVQGAFIALAS